MRIFHYRSVVSSNREKQSQFQRLQTHLHQNTDFFTRENQVLREFRKELDMLVQERMSHIEELRLIHADINIVCLNRKICLKMKFCSSLIDGNDNQTIGRRTSTSFTRK